MKDVVRYVLIISWENSKPVIHTIENGDIPVLYDLDEISLILRQNFTSPYSSRRATEEELEFGLSISIIEEIEFGISSIEYRKMLNP